MAKQNVLRKGICAEHSDRKHCKFKSKQIFQFAKEENDLESRTYLTHELRNDPVEGTSPVPVPFLVRAQAPEVFCDGKEMRVKMKREARVKINVGENLQAPRCRSHILAKDSSLT